MLPLLIVAVLAMLGFTLLSERVAEWISHPFVTSAAGLGVLVLAGMTTIALDVDTHLLTRIALVSTGGVEQKLVDAVHLVGYVQAAARATGVLAVEGELPSLAGATGWLNSPPLTAQSLRGKVAVVGFRIYSCINCIRALLCVRGRARKYKG